MSDKNTTAGAAREALEELIRDRDDWKWLSQQGSKRLDELRAKVDDAEWQRDRARELQSQAASFLARALAAESKVDEIQGLLKVLFAPEPKNTCRVTRDDHWCDIDQKWSDEGRRIGAERDKAERALKRLVVP